MARERLKSPRARLFVALDLPDPVRDGIALWGERELTDPALRAVRRESLHVTLCFLGYLPEKRIDEAARVLTSIEPRPVPIAFAPAPTAKPRSRPRFFALELDSPATGELQAELQERLVAARLYEPEKRPFWPHLTVAKVRPERGTRRSRRVERQPGELPQALVHTFGSVRVALYRSNLRPEGAQYVSLASLDLPPGPIGPGGEEG
jgi:RNA 2',3'-cyclic 3'-phosphodiesterase